eukprot:c16312_g1_i1 orf=58-228(+)
MLLALGNVVPHRNRGLDDDPSHAFVPIFYLFSKSLGLLQPFASLFFTVLDKMRVNV